VPVHELGLAADGQVYFTMRLVRGEDLKKIYGHVEGGHDGWSTTRALGVMLKVCEAMAYAHSKGVIHRDLKPANIMVGRYGEVYVMDWGMARVSGTKDLHDLRLGDVASSSQSVRTERRDERVDAPDSPLITRDGDVMGTPAYMPPEQARGEIANLGPHSDVYAVGAMLYHLLLVKHIEVPYVAKSARMSQHRLLMLAQEGPPTPIAQLDKSVPAPLVAIVEKAMQRDIARRYRDMEELAADLRAYVEGRVVKAHETGTWAETRQWVKRNKPLTGALAAAVLALAGGAVLALAQAREARQERNRANDNALLAEERAREAQAERDRANQNASRAEEEETAAKRNLALAERNAAEARAARDEAAQRANDVLSLSTQKDHDELVAQAASLWPASDAMAPRLEEWLRKARELVQGRPADEARGSARRPSLVEHKAKLEELRREALPLAPEQARVDRESHPRLAELRAKSAELQWRSRMLGDEAWPDAGAAQAELASMRLPSKSEELRAMAWKIVDPRQPIRGQEARALLLAQRAIAAAGPAEISGPHAAHAWALFQNGRLDAALSEKQLALAAPNGARMAAFLRDLDAAVDLWRGDELAKRREERDALAAEVASIARAVDARRTFLYADPQRAWWDMRLRELVADLEALQDEQSGLMGHAVAPGFFWGVQKRHEHAKSVRERTIAGPEARRRWDEAIAAIAKSERYKDTAFPGGGLLAPQEGLLPLGPDPRSGLWEFWHVQSGDEPPRGEGGEFERLPGGAHKLVEDGARGTGIVLVLIPGGSFWMGAQASDPKAPNHDPYASDSEKPVHRATVGPCFLSKYEMTQGQWARFVGVNPSRYQFGFTGTVAHTNPVEQVDWSTCMAAMRALDLELPTEAQWEHACRAGTNSPWWSGDAKEALVGQMNLADKSFASIGGPAAETGWWSEFDDGHGVHASAGSFPPNPFGLHEIAGNAWEWCYDAMAAYSAEDAVDPRVDAEHPTPRIVRGGAFSLAASYARSSYRHNRVPTAMGVNIGLRPARAVRPAID
jgi:formylglycine-generating enzyme required for sulfatase activity